MSGPAPGFQQTQGQRGQAGVETCLAKHAIEGLLEPLRGVVLGDLVRRAKVLARVLPARHALAGALHHDVEVHAEDARGRIVLDAKVDVLLDAKAEVAWRGKRGRAAQGATSRGRDTRRASAPLRHAPLSLKFSRLSSYSFTLRPRSRISMALSPRTCDNARAASRSALRCAAARAPSRSRATQRYGGCRRARRHSGARTSASYRHVASDELIAANAEAAKGVAGCEAVERGREWEVTGEVAPERTRRASQGLESTVCGGRGRTLGKHGLLLRDVLEHLGRLGQPIAALAHGDVENELLDLEVAHGVGGLVLALYGAPWPRIRARAPRKAAIGPALTRRARRDRTIVALLGVRRGGRRKSIYATLLLRCAGGDRDKSERTSHSAPPWRRGGARHK